MGKNMGFHLWLFNTTLMVERIHFKTVKIADRTKTEHLSSYHKEPVRRYKTTDICTETCTNVFLSDLFHSLELSLKTHGCLREGGGHHQLAVVGETSAWRRVMGGLALFQR